LHRAAILGNEAAGARLIMAGVDVNCVDAVDRCSPLHVAVVGGHTQLVADLLMGGAWTNVYNRQGDTPLHVAAKFAGHGRT
ncbi:unnamed protein product, partial [Ectocarpus sp. 12 AP-2014]